MEDARRRWDEYVATLSWTKGSLDDASWNAFLRAGSLGIPGDVALTEVEARITGAGGRPRPGKLRQQQERACAHAAQSPGLESRDWKPAPKVPKPDFQPDKLKRFAAPFRDLADAAWLADRSLRDPTRIDSNLFLRALYGRNRPTGEKVVVFTVFRSQGQCIWPDDPLPAGGPDGVWFLAQPVDGKFYPNPRQFDEAGKPKMSRRSEESVLAWRYLVLESDQADARDWIGALVRLPLPIAAIYTSGGKSIHALVQVDAGTKAQWDAIRHSALATMVVLGADPAAITAVRLTRLPGTMRGERPQRLLYLCAEPAATPICELPRRRDVLLHAETWANGLLMEHASAAAVDPEELAGLEAALLPWARCARAKAIVARLASWDRTGLGEALVVA